MSDLYLHPVTVLENNDNHKTQKEETISGGEYQSGPSSDSLSLSDSEPTPAASESVRQPKKEISDQIRNRSLIEPRRSIGEESEADDEDDDDDEVRDIVNLKPVITFQNIRPPPSPALPQPPQNEKVELFQDIRELAGPETKQLQKLPDSAVPESSESGDDSNESSKGGSLFSFSRFPGDLVFIIPAILATCAAGASQPIQTILMGKVFTALSKYAAGNVYDSKQAFMKDVTIYTMCIVGLSGAILLFQSVMVSFWDYYSSVQVRRAQEKTYFRFLGRDFTWYDKNKGIMGTLALLNRSFEDYRLATSLSLALNLRAVACITVALIIAFVFDWSLTLICLSALPVIIIFTSVTTAPMTNALVQYKSIIEDASSLVNWTLTSISTVKQFNAQYTQTRKFSELLDSACSHYHRFVIFAGLQQGISRFVMLTMFVPAFVYGARLVSKGSIQTGDVLTVFWSTMMIANSLSELGLRMDPVHKGLVASSRIKEFLDLGMSSSTYFKSMIGLFPNSCKGSITFRNVHFSYPSRPNVKVLRGLDLDIAAGQTVFVIGNSGCGKSTLSNILLRLYDKSKGVALVDGYPIETLSAKWLLNNITVVEQQSVLFNSTIRENIALGNCIFKEPMTEEQLESSISFATLQTVISSASKGLDTIVGPGGSRLSGGQRQRIALARARVRDTPILVLDESLSALDPSSRDTILRNIRQWREGKTTIIITHELSQIRPDDYVYVLHRGKAMRQGFRSELNNCSIFSESRMNSILIPDTPSMASPGTPHSPFSDYFQASPTTIASKRETIHIMDAFSMSSFDDSPRTPVTENKRVTMLNFEPKAGKYINTKRLSSVRPLSSFYAPLLIVDHKGENSIKNILESGNSPTEINRFLAPPVPYSPTSYFVFDSGNKPETKKEFRLGYISPKDTRDLPIPTLHMLVKCFIQIQPKPALFVGIAVAVINGGVTPIFSFAIAKIFTSMFPGAGGGSNSKWIALAIVIAFVDSVTIYLRTSVLCIVADRWVRSLRVKAFQSVTSRDVSWFINNKIDTGELSNLILNNTEDIRVIITLFLTVMATCVSLSLICVIWVMIIGWKLCMVALSLIPGSYLSYLTFKYFNGIWEAQCIAVSAKIDGIIYEMVSGIRTLRILGIEQYFNDAFKTTSLEYSVLKLKDSICKGIGFAISDFFPLACQGILLYYGMKLVADGEYTLNQVMIIFTILLFSITSISVLMTAIPQMNVPLLTLLRLFYLLDHEPVESQEATGQKLKMSLTGSTIIFNDVNFSYTAPKEVNSLEDDEESGDGLVFNSRSERPISSFSLLRPGTFDKFANEVEAVEVVKTESDKKNKTESKKKWSPFQHSKNRILKEKLAAVAAKSHIAGIPVLHNISTIIPKNSVVAIVGPSGSGKSTLTSILTKLYTPTSGMITIGGVDINNIDTDSLRSEIAVVGQAPLHFFRGTIRDNLTLGLSFNVSMDDLRRVCQECAIDDFISSLPDKYETIIGGSTGEVSSGATSLMSGGQMQRIGLARALLRQPKVLILDECTSGLDRKSTATILNRLEMYKQKRTMTILIITHQQEPTEIADIIITLSQGRIARREISKTSPFSRHSLESTLVT